MDLLVSYMPLASYARPACFPTREARCEFRYSGAAFALLNDILNASCNHSTPAHSSKGDQSSEGSEPRARRRGPS